MYPYNNNNPYGGYPQQQPQQYQMNNPYGNAQQGMYPQQLPNVMPFPNNDPSPMGYSSYQATASPIPAYAPFSQQGQPSPMYYQPTSYQEAFQQPVYAQPNPPLPMYCDAITTTPQQSQPQQRIILNSDQKVPMVLGPIIGLTTHNSSRILIEVNQDLYNVTVVCTPTNYPKVINMEQQQQFLNQSPQITPKYAHTFFNSQFGIPVIHIKVPELKANWPTPIPIHYLHPLSQYSVILYAENNAVFEREATIKTLSPTGLPYLKFACVSCNHYSQRDPKRDMWEAMMKEVDSIDYLIHMGDQIYTDNGNDAWDKSYKIYNAKVKSGQPITPEDERTVEDIFKFEYIKTWTHTPTQYVLSRVPSIMIHDDHEYRDDFGSKPYDSDPKSVDFQLGRICRKLYWMYQRQLRDDVFDHPEANLNNHEGYYVDLGKIGISMIDIRIARTLFPDPEKPFVTQRQWTDLKNAITKSNPNVLLFVCTVPLVFGGKQIVDTFSTKFDDLQDAWCYGNQHHEQIELLNFIYEWKNASPNRKVIILGGDIHVGATTTIKYKGSIMCEQLISSSIATRPPSWAAAQVMKTLMNAQGKVNENFTFVHKNFTNKNNYGIVHINSKDTQPDLFTTNLDISILLRDK